MAFIDISGYDIPKEYKTDLKNRFTNIVLGSKHLGSGTLTYTPSFHLKYLDVHELETIYAMDQLIFNVDRNHNKPNMLYRDSKIYLIDHERSWGFNKPEMNMMPTYYKDHIFYNVLRKMKSEPSIFDTFSYYLQNISYLEFAGIRDHLDAHGMDTTDFQVWHDYLTNVKANFANYKTILKGTLG